MAVCQFFLKGYCSFGNSCRNEHPRSDHSSRESNGRQGPTNTSLNRGVASPVTAPIASADRVPFTCKSLMRDMEAERPMWCLSSYAPDHRICVIAHLDESPEELRVRATQARKQGTFEEYLKYEAEKLSAATAQFTSALSDIRGFYDIVSKSYRAQSSCASAATQTITWNAGPTNDSKPAFRQSAFGPWASGQPSVCRPLDGSTFWEAVATASAFVPSANRTFQKMPVSTALDTVDTIPPGTSTSTLGKASQSSFVSGQRSAHAENAVAPNPATTVVSRQPETATTSPTDRSRAAEATTAVDPPTSKTISTSLKPDLGGSPSRDPAQAGTSVAGEQRSPGRSSATMGPSDSCSCAQRPTRESAEDILRLNDPNMPSLLRVRWQQRVAGFNSTSVEHIVGKACTYFRLGHPEDEFVLTMDMDGDKLEVTDDILGRLRNGSVVTLKRLQKLDAVDDSRNDPATDSPQGNCVPQPRCDGRSA